MSGRLSCRVLKGMKGFGLLAAIWLGAASFAGAQSPCVGVANSPTGNVTWTPNWCDEFSGSQFSAINPANWTFDTGNNNGFGNNELETYCDPSSNTFPCDSLTPNAYIDGSGNLAIQVRGPANSDCTAVGTCTSARLKTAGLQIFHSGRIEARLQIPSQTGLWTAFWNLGSQPGVTWPTVGESDIMENWPAGSSIAGPDATGNCSTIHTQATAGNGKGHCFTLPTGQRIDTAFHTYGQIWSANMIQYYIDTPSQPYFVVTSSDLPAGDTWPFSSAANPFFLILNVAIGGTLGNPTNTATSNPPPLLADYVRQYLPSPVPAPSLTPNGSISVTAGATTGNTATVDMLGATGTGRVTFSCTTNAPKASCLVTSNDPVNNHTVDFSTSNAASPTVTVITTANTSSSGISSLDRIGLAGGIVLVLLMSFVSRNARAFKLGAGVACAILAIGLAPGCGGGSSTTTTPPPPNGTPAGNYTVTVNAFTVSSSDASIPDASTPITLTVH